MGEVSHIVIVTFLTTTHQVMSMAMQYPAGIPSASKNSILNQVCNFMVIVKLIIFLCGRCQKC